MEHKELFKFAAKAGSLEGYLYEREKIEPLYNWMGNIESMYANLPEAVKSNIREDVATVLTRALSYGDKVLDEEIKTRLSSLLSRL